MVSSINDSSGLQTQIAVQQTKDTPLNRSG